MTFGDAFDDDYGIMSRIIHDLAETVLVENACHFCRAYALKDTPVSIIHTTDCVYARAVAWRRRHTSQVGR